MDNNWWELPEMSAGQAQDFVDGIRNINEIAVSNVLESVSINGCYNTSNYKQFVGALDERGRHYRFTKE